MNWICDKRGAGITSENDLQMAPSHRPHKSWLLYTPATAWSVALEIPHCPAGRCPATPALGRVTGTQLGVRSPPFPAQLRRLVRRVRREAHSGGGEWGTITPPW
jgi:hypothetical protein